jgi:hypothetical protein
VVQSIAMGITQIEEWYNRLLWESHKLKSGTIDSDMAASLVESDALSSRPSTSRNDENSDQIRTLVMPDRSVTVREFAEEVGIRTGSVHSIFTDA